MEVADAYAIQQVNLARRLAAGRTLVGHKIGLTSRADADPARRRPTRFRLHPRHHGDRHRAGVPRSRFCSPRVEPEVAFCCASLRGPGIGIEQVRAATEAVAVALEIVDSRIADWKLTLPDTVADSASSGAVVLGDWVPYTGPSTWPARGRRCGSTEPRSTPGSARRCWATRPRRSPG